MAFAQLLTTSVLLCATGVLSTGTGGFIPLSSAWQIPKFPTQLPHQGKFKPGAETKDPKKLWLIPRDPITCSSNSDQTWLNVAKDKVTVQDCTTGSRTLRFPGCVHIAAELEVLQNLSTNLFANVQFQWANLPQLGESLKCEKQEPNGCNGIGNNCFYCDICKGISSIQGIKSVLNNDSINCPTEPKTYRLERQFNVSDWNGLDENHNGVIDMLEEDNLARLREYFKAIDVVGFGTLSITLQLAKNATESQLKSQTAEQSRIATDIRKKYKNSERSGRQVQEEIESEINYWHRNSYLPWLLNTNQLSCVTFLFDVCLNEPSPFSLQSYQCL